MHFNYIKINNFQSLEDVEFSFPKGLVLVDGWNEDLGSHNGVGKSALLNAIVYAVYGKTPKDVNLSELPRTGSTEFRIEISLKSGANDIVITRTKGVKKSATTTLMVNGEEVGGSLKDKDENILNLIGLSFEQFLQIVYVFQGAQNRFITLNDTEKKRFLSTLLNLDVYDNAYKIAHSKLTQLELQLSGHNGSLLVYERNLSGAISKIESSQLAIDNFKVEKEGKLAGILLKVNTLKQELKELELLQIQSSKSNVMATLLAKKNGIQELVNKNTLNKKNILDLDRNIDTLKREIVALEKEQEYIQKQQCSQCKQTLPWDSTLGDNIMQKIAAAHNKIAIMEDAKQEIAVVEDSTLSTMMEKIYSEIAIEKANGPEKYDAPIAAKKSELKSLSLQLENINGQEAYLQRGLAEAEQVLRSIRSDIDATKVAINFLEDEKKYLLELKKIFSPTGIRAYVFEGLINEINDKISEYLDSLSENTIKFSFESDESNGKFVEVCEHTGTQRSIHSLSGGEFRRLSLAVDLALSDVVCNRMSIYPNVLFLDEALEGLDMAGREIVLSLLTDVVQKKEAVYVVDHASELKAAFNNVFKLIKRNGSTYVDAHA